MPDAPDLTKLKAHLTQLAQAHGFIVDVQLSNEVELPMVRKGVPHIQVSVHNRVWGPLFGYRGSFDVQWRKVAASKAPSHILPLRQEQRD